MSLTSEILLDIREASRQVASGHGPQFEVQPECHADVGCNQLAYSLRQDPLVVNGAKRSFRYTRPDQFQEGQPGVASIDVSFISTFNSATPLVLF